MKASRTVEFLVIASCCGQAAADCNDQQSYLSVAQVQAILGNNYVCGRSASDPPGWNERHVAAKGGVLIEQHEGGTSPETVGTWSTANAAGRGRVTYSYKGGTAPVYEITVVNGSCTGASCTTLPQTYAFCGVGGGAPSRLVVYVSKTFQAPSGPPWVMNANCPMN